MKLKRLYYLFPHITYTKRVVDTLLLYGIGRKHLYVLAQEGTALDGLPEGGVFEKSDVKHSIALGLLFGGVAGLCVGFSLCHIFDLKLGGWIVGAMVLGALLGAWGASMIGLSVENVELKPFVHDMEAGKILLMIDVPLSDVEAIVDHLNHKHHCKKYQYVATTPNYYSFP